MDERTHYVVPREGKMPEEDESVCGAPLPDIATDDDPTCPDCLLMVGDSASPPKHPRDNPGSTK